MFVYLFGVGNLMLLIQQKNPRKEHLANVVYPTWGPLSGLSLYTTYKHQNLDDDSIYMSGLWFLCTTKILPNCKKMYSIQRIYSKNFVSIAYESKIYSC